MAILQKCREIGLFEKMFKREVFDLNHNIICI